VAGKARLFGVPVDLRSIDETVQRCRELIEQRRPVQHAFIHAAETVMLEDVPGFRGTLAGCDIVDVDGQSNVWAARRLIQEPAGWGRATSSATRGSSC
jgi:N-acetylglucosaminyldiphosphoundecaprenol N-acetyl-beta-D-mannosaminyltransferase